MRSRTATAFLPQAQDIFCENYAGYALRESTKNILSKNNNNWCTKSAGLEAPNYIKSVMV